MESFFFPWLNESLVYRVNTLHVGVYEQKELIEQPHMLI